METEFDITLTQKDMYRFNLYHSYSGMHGISSIIMAVLIFLVAGKTYGSIETSYTILYVAFGIIFLFYLPISLYVSAGRRIKLTETLRLPLHYKIDKDGVHTSQNGASADLPWEQIYKIVSTKHSVLIYSNRINAYVIPKDQLTGQYEKICEIAKAHLPKYRCKLK